MNVSHRTLNRTETKADDICLLTYPKPTSCVTLGSSLNFWIAMCKRKELSWHFPKILSSSTILSSSCSYFTLLRNGNVFSTSQGQFQLTSAMFLQKLTTLKKTKQKEKPSLGLFPSYKFDLQSKLVNFVLNFTAALTIL